MRSTTIETRTIRGLVSGSVVVFACATIATGLGRIALRGWSSASAASWAGADPTELLIGLCAILGAAIAGWLGLATTVSALAAVPGAVGRLGDLCARQIAPAALRRWVAVLVGSAVAAAAVPGTAAAVVGGEVHTVVAPTGDTSPDPAFRPVGPAPSFAPPTSSTAPAQATLPAPAPATVPSMSAPRPTTTVAVTVPVRDPGFVAVPPPAAAATPADMTPLERVPRATIGPGTPEPAHVVRRGDTLWDIAAAHLGSGATRAAIAEAWPRWYAANRTVIGPDPGHIEPGQRLISPSATR